MRPQVNEPAPQNEPDCTLNINIKSKTKTNGTVISEDVKERPKEISSNVSNMALIQEIESVTGDRKSRGCFISIVRQVPEDIVYMALTSLKIAMGEGIVSKPGAYFVGTVKKQCPNIFAPNVKEVAPERISYHNPTWMLPWKASQHRKRYLKLLLRRLNVY